MLMKTILIMKMILLSLMIQLLLLQLLRKLINSISLMLSNSLEYQLSRWFMIIIITLKTSLIHIIQNYYYCCCKAVVVGSISAAIIAAAVITLALVNSFAITITTTATMDSSVAKGYDTLRKMLVLLIYYCLIPSLIFAIGFICICFLFLICFSS